MSPLGSFTPIPRAIERAAERHPDRIAYHHEARTLSYGEVDRLADALADALADGLGTEVATRAVAPGVLVPVLIDAGFELPIAYLALMKLGAAFVPIDPAWPEARRSEALAQLGAAPILCRTPSAVPAAFAARAHPVALGGLRRASERRPSAALGPDDLLYGIFTSGTTGRPRCALNTHAGLANRFAFMSRRFVPGASAAAPDGLPSLGPILQSCRPAFDTSVWQLLWPLTFGGSVVLPSAPDGLDLARLVDLVALIGRHAVAMTDFVPSVLVQLVGLVERDQAARARLGSLRELIVGGEAIAPRAVHRLRALLPDLRVTNAYGPTEAAIGMVFHTVEASDGDTIPLGRPIDNCHVVVVDEALHPLPTGARGELLLGGACVGRGYLGDPDATARAFIPNPFAPAIPGERLYRSGDLGYVDAAGRLHFAGRRDDQVKLGGVRIELGELAAVAERHPAVTHARAFVATEGGGGERTLALAVASPALDPVDLRRHLAATLPRALVPQHLVVLPALPLTPHGKVDVAALEATLARQRGAAARVEAGHAGHAIAADPSGPSVLADVLALARKAIGGSLEVTDRLGDHGLDSLRALALALALARRFDVDFGPHELADNPSPADLATRIEALQATGAASDAAPAPDGLLMDRDARFSLSPTRSLARAPSLSPTRGPTRTAAPRAVLLTGASGFVGSYLAEALLAAPDGPELYALVRPANADLPATLRRKRLWRDPFARRLHVMRGDLTLPQLGLDADTYAHLAERCDAIVHAGALVNLLFDYRAHRATNVLGTAALAELAALERPKALHHISTLGIYERAAAASPTPLSEAITHDRIPAPDGGYSRSKWVAERLLGDAQAAGIAVTLHRLGEVMPASRGGEPNPRALTHLLLSAFVQLRAVPDVSVVSDWSPVDWVAAAIVGAVLRSDAPRAPRAPAACGAVYHHFHPARVPFDQALARAGLDLPRLPPEAWIARLHERLEAAPTRALSQLAALVPGPGALAQLLADNPRLFVRVEGAALGSALGLAEPGIDAAIRAYAARLIEF